MLGRISFSRFVFFCTCITVVAVTASAAVEPKSGAEAKASELTAEEVIHVRQGQSFRIAEHAHSLVLKQLILEDNAVLILPSSQPSFSITAVTSRIGTNVKIIGRGDDASEQTEAVQKLVAAVDCASPSAGPFGANGADGNRGVDFSLNTEFSEFGSLLIDLSGGAGSDGLPGGAGQDADQSSGCEKQRGGQGGQGGSAGFGGAGGDAKLQLAASSNTLLARVKQHLILVNAAGNGGQAGAGGKGGKGSAGRYINRKSLYGNKTWVAGGKKGVQGAQGSIAQRSQAGRKQLQFIALNAPNSGTGVPVSSIGTGAAHGSLVVPAVVPEAAILGASANSNVEPALQRRVELLEAQVTSLLQRIDALEQAKD